LAYASLIVYVLLLFIRPWDWVPAMLNWHIMTVVTGVAIFTTLLEMVNREWHFKDAPQNWLVLGFFVAVVASNLFCFQRPFYFAGTKLAFTEFGKIILLYFLISINLRSLRQVKGFIAVVIIGCLFMAIHGILQIHTGSGFGSQLESLPLFVPQTQDYRIRAFGAWADPNDLAQALVMVLPFLISGIHRPGVAAPRRLVSLVLAGVIGYGIFLTGSRDGWLALAVMTIAYFLLNFRVKKIAVVFGVLALLGLMIVAPSRVHSGSTIDESARGRLVAWAAGNTMLKMSPIFGVGKGGFEEYSEHGLIAHNSFVQCWAELGLFGYFWWLGMLFASVKDSYALGKERSDDPEKGEMGRLARVLLASWIGFLASALFLTRTYTAELFILIGLVAAMHAIREREGGPLRGAFVRRDCRWVLAAELTSIPFFYVMMRFMW
jgi:O-antigen ligase